MYSNFQGFSDPIIRTIRSDDDGDDLRVLIQLEKLDEVWYAETVLPLEGDQTKHPWHWDLPPRKIDPTYAYPAFSAVSTTIADQDDVTGYEKKIDLLREALSLLCGFPDVRDTTLREIHVCEVLRQSRHPNVCFYHGVRVDCGLVTGLMFDRYDMTLREFLYKGYPIDVSRCVQHIRNGIQVFHNQGLVHYDIKPENIFVDVKNLRFVLGDFDSVHREGVRLTLKVGTPGWVPEDEDTADIARYEIDWYSLAMIQVWLEKKVTIGRDVRDQYEERFCTTHILGNARQLLKAQPDGRSPPSAPDPSSPKQNEEDEMDTSW
jgi:serine/threonine protein kinase